MKTIALMLLAFLVAENGVLAQSGKERREAAEKKAASERLRSIGGQRTSNELKDDRGEAVSLTAGEVAPGPAGSESDTAERKTGAVIQITTTESGSPSILSGNNGRSRDGTGNVQRASPNMVGSPVPRNLNLVDKNPGQRNMNTPTEVREQEEQPAARNDDLTGEKPKITNDEGTDKKQKEDRKSRRKRKRGDNDPGQQ